MYASKVVGLEENVEKTKYSGALVCEHNSFWQCARNPKHSYIKANFTIRNNGNSDDSFQN
jgi:hypothetical protein